MDQWLDFSDFIDKAQELIDFGLYDEAKALLDKYEDSFSREWELHFLYSRLYAEQNRPEEAIPRLQSGLRLDPDNVDCLVGLFYAYAMINRMAEAGRYLLQAEKYHPDHELVLSALVWYHTEMNDHAAAIACFERVRARGADNPETWRNAGLAYDRSGSYEAAAECFRTALDLHPGYDEARELLSDLYIANNRPEKAVALYEQALADSPHNIRYLSRLTFCLSQNDNTRKAVAIGEESVRLYPNSPVGHIDLAYVYLNAGALDKALNAALKALDISPLDAEAHRAKALILSEKGNDGEAERAFLKAIDLDRNNNEILRDYYHHCRHVRAWAKMEETAYRVIATGDPSCVEDYWFLADYYREKKEYGKAMACLSKAYTIRPGEHDLLALVADVLIARGHVTFALRFLRSYVERVGWDDAASRIAAGPQLRDRRVQEGLRFMRFCGSAPADFHRFLFMACVKRCAAVSFVALAAATAVPVFLLSGAKGLAFLGSGAVALAAIFYGAAIVRRRSMRPALVVLP